MEHENRGPVASHAGPAPADGLPAERPKGKLLQQARVLIWAVVDAHGLAGRPALPGPADPARDKRSLQSRISRLGQVQEWRHDGGVGRVWPRRNNTACTQRNPRTAWLLHEPRSESRLLATLPPPIGRTPGLEGPPLVMDSPPTNVGVTGMSLSEALALGPDAWDALLGHAKSPSPFMSWAWHRAWADSAPLAELNASNALALHGAEGSLHALLPVRLSRVRFRRVWVRALIWAVGDVGCPDELDVPAVPDADWPAVGAALEALPWQVIILSNLAEGAPNAKHLCDALEERGHAVRHSPLFSCPSLELPASWDAYLATLSSNRRQILRRKERSLFRDYAARLVDYQDDRLDEGWGHLMRLHEQRWDGAGGGAFRDPRTERLQRAFAGEMAKQKRLWLSTLDLEGQPAAAWYGFTAGKTVYFYQGGRDPRWERESVGQVLMGMMIQRAIQQGFRTFNFLRGDDRYKQQWTSDGHMTHEAVIFRSGWRGRWLRTLDTMAALRARVGARV